MKKEFGGANVQISRFFNCQNGDFIIKENIIEHLKNKKVKTLLNKNSEVLVNPRAIRVLYFWIEFTCFFLSILYERRDVVKMYL